MSDYHAEKSKAFDDFYALPAHVIERLESGEFLTRAELGLTYVQVCDMVSFELLRPMRPQPPVGTVRKWGV